MSPTDKKDKKIKLDKELEDALKEVCKLCRQEDLEVRKTLVRQWKKAEEFWHGTQYLFWDSINELWRSAEISNLDDDYEDENQQGSFSDKVIDIYKAHGEAIISALSAQIPGLRFLPDDADSTVDVVTARTYTKIGELIQKHNKAKLVFMRALFFLANHGLVASYRYKDSDFSYGSNKVPVFATQKLEQVSYTCENCGYQSDQNWQQAISNDSGKSNGSNGKKPAKPSKANAVALAAPIPCPQCGELDKPKEEKQTVEVPIQTGIEDRPKTRIKMDVFGPLHFKVPHYARNQSECTYFGLYMDQGKDIVAENYPDLYDEIMADRLESTERFARANYVYPFDDQADYRTVITVERWWLRPAALNRCQDKDKRDKLKKKFGDKGCKVTLLGREFHFAEVEEEKLDDRWEIGQAGLSTYIHSDALLRPLIQIQELRNQLVNLIIETIEHGIPSEFADPAVVNFNTYGRFEAVPGYIYQTKAARPGEPLANSFYTTNRSTLANESLEILKQLDEDAQFCSGSFPSIYGGPSEGKSRTFAEYAASRQMALQRLSIVWNLITDWWVRTIKGAVDMYVEVVVDDDKYTKFEDGNYVNVWIKRSQMQGKIGGVEPDASEGFPISTAQKKDLILKFIEMNNDFINAALYKPENARLIQDTLAMTEFKLPGETQRIKQVIEINQIIRLSKQTGGPILDMVPGLNGSQEVWQSSVPIDPDVDDDAIHIETIVSYCVDLPGLELKDEDPSAYADIVAHLKMHQQNLIKKTLTMAGGTPAGQAPETAHAGVEE